MKVTASILSLLIATTACGQAPFPTPAEEPERPVEVAPSGSLFKQGLSRRAAMIAADQEVSATMSLTAVPVVQPRKFKKADQVTVIVREDSESNSSGTGQSEKKQDFDVALQQFLELGRFAGTAGLGNVASPGKLPEVKFKYDNKRDNSASQGRKDTFTARIQAEVVDVKPNGTLVVEAVKHITVDKEEQIYRLSGVVRAADVTIDNTVLSTQVARLSLNKQTKGEVRQGTKSGWFNQVWDKVSPF